MQRWVVDNADRIARTIVGETGKAYEDAMLAEVMYGAAAFGFWAKRAPRWLADRRVRSTAPAVLGKRLLVRYEPLGVVGVIGPWNYPLTNSFGDAIPALAAGNAVVLKPSEHTPLTSLLLAEGLAASAACPTGVFAVATGAGPTAEALVDLVDMVQFTGSTATGRKVAVRAARAPHPRLAGARRQGPDDRPRRRRPRAGRERRRLLRDAERGADVHLRRARVRRGRGARRVRAPLAEKRRLRCARATRAAGRAPSTSAR